MALNFANNNSLSDITALPTSISGGALNLISTQTASASASLEFSLDDSYDSYIFKFINIHPATDGTQFQFQTSTNSGASYGVTATTTFFQAYHQESGGASGIQYASSLDLAQSTSFQNITGDLGNQNDECGSGYLHLFNPSSSTFVKHFITRENGQQNNEQSVSVFTAGYFNTTSPITNLKFQMSSGNIDDGIIKMYGVS